MPVPFTVMQGDSYDIELILRFADGRIMTPDEVTNLEVSIGTPGADSYLHYMYSLGTVRYEPTVVYDENDIITSIDDAEDGVLYKKVTYNYTDEEDNPKSITGFVDSSIEKTGIWIVRLEQDETRSLTPSKYREYHIQVRAVLNDANDYHSDGSVVGLDMGYLNVIPSVSLVTIGKTTE